MKWILPLCLLAAPAFAQSCPPVTDYSDQFSEIEDDLRRTASEAEAGVLSQQLWELWLDAPDPIAQELLDEGMARRLSFDFLGSLAVLGRLIDYCPDYAEGYNQRAFSSFLARDFEAALVDLDKTLAILPNHIGALSGKGLTLLELGRNDEAQEALRAAVALNPWLAERALLTEPAGTDL